MVSSRFVAPGAIAITVERGGGEGAFPEAHTLLGNDLFRRLTSPIAMLIRWTPIEERMKGLLEDYGIESF